MTRSEKKYIFHEKIQNKKIAIRIIRVKNEIKIKLKGNYKF
jgi:hypothetical protein